jgi:predicted O-linked N-acetylglucosamine transferase (SPINDLY family)
MPASPPLRNAPCPCGSGRRYKHCHGASATTGHAPDEAAVLFEQGNAARAQGRIGEAIAHFERALRQLPAHVGLLNNLGLTLEDAGRLRDAEARFRAALEVAADAFEPLANLAQNLYKQKRYAAALEFFDRLAARGDVRSAGLFANRGVCHIHAGDQRIAEESLRAALAIEPHSTRLLCDLGALHARQQRFVEAAGAFEAALAVEPDLVPAASWLLFCRLNLADWRDFDALRARVIAAAGQLEAHPVLSSSPFNLQAVCDDPALQRIAAESWMRNRPVARRVSVPRAAGGPLRLGFVSMDFGEHPVGRLLVDLLARLDPGRFHVTAYALGPRTDDRIRARLRAAVAQWRESVVFHAEALADAIRADHIDVLFDLAGFTGWPLLDIFLRRPAPVQVNFLGYTGTMGSPAYDWIVTDRHCIGAGDAKHYTERALYVEPCYMPSDSRRVLDAGPLSRAQYSLPAGALVLCAFSGTYKILPEMFGAWMRVLARHPEAVLWLRDSGSPVNERLRAAARERGVDPVRLAFAPTEPWPRYLARFRLADLFVDTAPFGAHTTVNDALFAGLPVLTLEGRSFAGRASASQVRTAGLAQLVARDLDDYERKAGELVGDRTMLRAAADTLRTAAAPLFDMTRYAQVFGDAVLAAWNARTGAP